MPRETINAARSDYVVKVGWDHLGNVQVGVATEGERSLWWTLLGDDGTRARLGEAIRALGQLGGMDDDARARSLLDTMDGLASYSAVWSILDRADCNKLISTTRRARDAAFGGDE